MDININNLYIFYLILSILGLAIVLVALPTILHQEVVKAAKKLGTEGLRTGKAIA
ncbi:MAG: hypothetical protein FJ044_05610 [Candidatus Cloacimonetes bacterium]|nr:hypothetical protein [Candidatus Cloacimonadota bacterium]